MLWTAYFRRRLVFLCILVWITTLLFVYSLLAEDVDLQQPMNGRLKLLMEHNQDLDRPILQAAHPVRVRDADPVRFRPERLTHEATPSIHDQEQHKAMNPFQAENKPRQLSQSQADESVISRHETDARGNSTDREASLLLNKGVAEYCNRNNVLPTPQEGMAPPGFRLRSVHIVTRHGDRAPLYSFSGRQNPPLSCQFQPQELQTDSRLAAYVTTMKGWDGHQKEDGGFQRWALYPDRKLCTSSQLTTIGVKQMLELGYLLHERYVQKWKLLGPRFQGGDVSVRSTEYTRTYQSATAFLYAFLPEFNLTKVPIKRSTNFFFCAESTLAAPCTCPVLRSWKHQAEVTVEAMLQNKDKYDSLLNAVANVYDLPKSRLPVMWAMIDVFLSHACNVLPLPCNKRGQCITPHIVSQLWGHVTNYTRARSTLRKYKEYVSLALHPFLNEVVEHMVGVSTGQRSVKINVYSGHDTTLIPLEAVFGIGGGTWPRYASRIALELYSRDSSRDHYIRVVRDGVDVTHQTTMCRGQFVNKMCPLKNFVDFVERENLGQFKDNDYLNICYSPS